MKTLIYSILTFMLVAPMFVFAQQGNPPGYSVDGQGNPPCTNSVCIPNPLGDLTLMGLFQTILNVVMIFAVPLVVFFIIFAGFKYVTAQGNPDKISEANKALLYALIGGLLILGANVLIEVISGTVDAIAN